MISQTDDSLLTLTTGEPEGLAYVRRPSLVLINGLAEQSETWFANERQWSRHYSVTMPAILVYGGEVLQARMEQGLPISVEYLTDRLERYLDDFVQSPPYHLAASSLGCQIIVEYALRRPEKVGRLVLLCPSGVAADEHLPVGECARRRDFGWLVGTVFQDQRCVLPGLVQYYESRFANRQWRKSVFRTVQDTRSNSIRQKLRHVAAPTLVICGEEDRIVDPLEVAAVAGGLPNFTVELLPNCGHAPHIEMAETVNEMVLRFLGGDEADPARKPRPK